MLLVRLVMQNDESARSALSVYQDVQLPTEGSAGEVAKLSLRIERRPSSLKFSRLLACRSLSNLSYPDLLIWRLNYGQGELLVKQVGEHPMESRKLLIV